MDKHAHITGFVMKQGKHEELITASGSWIDVQEKLMDVVGSSVFR